MNENTPDPREKLAELERIHAEQDRRATEIDVRHLERLTELLVYQSLPSLAEVPERVAGQIGFDGRFVVGTQTGPAAWLGTLPSRIRAARSFDSSRITVPSSSSIAGRAVCPVSSM